MIWNNNNQQAEKNKSDDSTCSHHSTKRMLFPDLTISTNNSNSNQNILNTNASDYLVKPHNKRHKKSKHSQYKPEKDMSKEELTQWRKHQRKLRNRQSAAASRQKVRNRVHNLEEQVQLLQHKYNIVLNRLKQYEPFFNENELHNEQEQPDDVVSYSVSPSLPSVVSCNDSISIDTNTNTISIPSSPSTTLDTHIEAQQLIENITKEPQLVEEHQQEINSDNNGNYNTSNILDIFTNSDDQELEDFLSYAFSETE